MKRALATGYQLAFTMAEILLSLTIIGVVAAITLPSLTGNINERTWNTQRKALYARMSQAISLMPALNGYGTLTEATSSTSAVDTAAETFITDGLAKVLKINNICDSQHLEDCGVPNTITTLDGHALSNFTSSYNTLVSYNNLFSGSISGGFVYHQQDTKAAAFETQNGESILVYYNPKCVADQNEIIFHYVQPKMCANFIYDLNGNKGPNTFGKDIGFITALYPTDSVVVAPIPLGQNKGSYTHMNAGKGCNTQDAQSRVPNRAEMAAMFYNIKLLELMQGFYWTSEISPVNTSLGWYQEFPAGTQGTVSRELGYAVRCIKR